MVAPMPGADLDYPARFLDHFGEQFALVDEKGRSYDCYRCRDMNTEIIPGGQVEGRISFTAYTDPRELIFTHPKAGKLVRRIPQY